MSILVTGATGFLGSALTTQLVKQKQPVRILARDEQKARMQFGEAVTIIRGEITDVEQVERAVDGSSIIYHLAGRLYHPSVPANSITLPMLRVQGTCSKPAKGSIPLWLANLASDVFSLIPGIRGENAPLTRSRVQFLTHSRVYDISKAKAELGFVPGIGLDLGMKNTAEWYHKHSYL